MQEYGAAAIWDGIGRHIVFDDDSIGVLGHIVFQMLHIAVVPAGFQQRVIPLLPGVKVDGIGIANPIRVWCDIPPRHLNAIWFFCVAKCGTQGPQACRRGIGISSAVVGDSIGSGKTMHSG